MFKKIAKKVNRNCKNAFLESLYACGIKKHAHSSSAQMILCYHGIDLRGSTKFNSKFTSLKSLIAQFKYFKNNFDIVSLKKFMEKKDEPKNKFTMAITFDDGYRNNYKYVLPLIEEFKIPVTFFITGISDTDQKVLCADLLDLGSLATNSQLVIGSERYKKNIRSNYIRMSDGKSLKELFHIMEYEDKMNILSSFPSDAFNFKQDHSLEDYYEQMTVEEIREISVSNYATIGSHSFYHNDLSSMSLQDARRDILDSKIYLEKIIQKEVCDFAFPYGRYTDELLDVCGQIGLRSALPLSYETETRKAIIHERFGANPYIGKNTQLHYILKGSYA